jgi:hypothetical protein
MQLLTKSSVVLRSERMTADEKFGFVGSSISRFGYREAAADQLKFDISVSRAADATCTVYEKSELFRSDPNGEWRGRGGRKIKCFFVFFT